MRKFCCMCLAMLPLTAFAYPIELEKNIEKGISLDYTTYATDYDIGSITLNNYGETPALCTLVFRNGPESPRTRRVSVAARSKTEVSAKFSRKIIKLRIDLACKAK